MKEGIPPLIRGVWGISPRKKCISRSPEVASKLFSGSNFKIRPNPNPPYPSSFNAFLAFLFFSFFEKKCRHVPTVPKGSYANDPCKSPISSSFPIMIINND